MVKGILVNMPLRVYILFLLLYTCTYIYTYLPAVYTYMLLCVCIYVYIYKHREREFVCVFEGERMYTHEENIRAYVQTDEKETVRASEAHRRR